MNKPVSHWKKLYPNLFKETLWFSGLTTIQFMVSEPPPEYLVSNVNAVPITENGQFVVIRLADGTWEIPGGTVEPNEEPRTTLKRELLEEAGAQLESAAYVGTWKMVSQADQPFRPHLPHPVAYRVVYFCAVTLVSAPQIPEEDGENVMAVMTMGIDDAVKCFNDIERYELAELYQFAAVLNEIQG